jgi:hypothetical protein
MFYSYRALLCAGEVGICCIIDSARMLHNAHLSESDFPTAPQQSGMWLRFCFTVSPTASHKKIILVFYLTPPIRKHWCPPLFPIHADIPSTSCYCRMGTRVETVWTWQTHNVSPGVQADIHPNSITRAAEKVNLPAWLMSHTVAASLNAIVATGKDHCTTNCILLWKKWVMSTMKTSFQSYCHPPSPWTKSRTNAIVIICCLYISVQGT